MPTLVASKAMRLGGRSYAPGDTFEVRTEAQARVLVATGKASKEAVDAARDAGRDALRQQAEALGVEVDGRWGSTRLQEEIAAVQQRRREAAAGTYSRRDMVAEPARATSAEEPAGSPEKSE